MIDKKNPKLKQYFWDVQWKDFNPKAYPDFTIERILEYGDESATHWLTQQFSRKEIIFTLKHSRKLSSKSAHYWSLIYTIKPNQIVCLKIPSHEKQSRAWKS